MTKVVEWLRARHPITWLLNDDNFLALVISGVIVLFTMGIAIAWMIITLLAMSMHSFWVQLGFMLIIWAGFYRPVRAYIGDDSPTNDAECEDDDE
jgi:hypothetical protein